MSEFEDKINAILGNPAEMEKITKLAAQFMGGGQDRKEEPAPAAQSTQQNLGGFDPEMLSKISRLMSKVQSSGGSDKTELLRVMSPYLAKERREKMEKAIKFAHIAKIAGIALKEYGGGGNV